MRILFDLQHPAHLHFFRNVIERLKEEGHSVKVTGRDKDILVDLADNYHVEVEFFGTARKGIINLSYELLYRQWRLFRIIREFRPDCMMAIAGTFISSLGYFLKIPVYVFYDTEHATISNLLAYPFATCVYVPRCYRKNLHVRHIRYDGYHELAYLHPNYFTPDPAVLSEAGLREGDRFSIVRFVGWGAAHDIGMKGFTDENKIEAVRRFAQMGKVFISSEGDLPDPLRPYRVPVGVEKIHHLMAFASLVFGESATMASEAAVLGVPAVYLDPVGRGYTDEQERKYGIVFNFKPEQQAEAINKGAQLLGKADRDYWKGIGRRIVRENEDVTKIIYNVALRRPFTRNSGMEGKREDVRRRMGQAVHAEDYLIDRYHDILLRVASHFHLPAVSHSDIPAGVNGPHLEDRTNNLRVTSHLTILSYYLYQITGERGYLDWVKGSISHIEGFKDPQTGVYLNTAQAGKDPNNALLGQAWVIQALLYISDILGPEKIRSMILDVIESHLFDEKNNVYMYPMRNGSDTIYLPDFTLNHQVWFSAMVSGSRSLGKEAVFREQQGRFLDVLGNKIRYKKDRVNHLIVQEIPLTLKLKWVSSNPRKLIVYLWRQLTGNYRSMSTGYVPFCLWGIYDNADLYHALGDTRTHLDGVLTYFIRNSHILKANNPFTWGYNMSGIELAISYLRRYRDLDDVVLNVLTKQIDPPQDYVIADFTTYMARHYELVYLIDVLKGSRK